MVRTVIKSIILIFIGMMLFSCENNIETIKKITSEDTLIGVSAYDIKYVRTDSGRLQMTLNAPKMISYEGKVPYTEFPEGFTVFLYDKNEFKTAFITANYGIDYSSKKYLKARNDVVVKNFETKEQLNTENLDWNQKKKMIYARSFVKITAPDKLIFGDSLEATEDFSRRTIYNIHKSEIETDDNDN